ncbi:hypothetical protein [Streptomyces sp. c-19]|uniref:hypothetical protein n=1 Tax=Streptomyces sp. c-19 TaxID=2789275 RepID=UPI00398138B2
MVDVRARFGFTAAPGTTDDARLRHLTLAVPPEHAARLLDAQEPGPPNVNSRGPLRTPW